MPVSVEIDRHSGFCGGVIRAIGRAEDWLDSSAGKNLFSLGAIVHNEAELERLEGKGLVTLDYQDLEDMARTDGETLLIRAHGEPPATYSRAAELGFNVIDCTCPVVLRLQAKIKEAYARLHGGGRGGQLIIFGKIGHAEVLGLLGQVGGDALVIDSRQMLSDALGQGRVNLDGPVEVFSQTTMSPAEYADICAVLSEAMAESHSVRFDTFKASGLLTVHNTICSQVASRHELLTDFAIKHDVIVFVAGKTSSNGKVLCELCRRVNIRSYHVCGPADIRREWFRPDDAVGVCGATSTPKWLLEAVAEKILHFA